MEVACIGKTKKKPAGGGDRLDALHTLLISMVPPYSPPGVVGGGAGRRASPDQTLLGWRS